MALGDREKLNRIEELKGKLFSKNFQTKIEHRDSFPHSNKVDTPEEWQSEPEIESSGKKFFMKTPLFKNFFIFSLGFFILALGYAGYIFFVGGNTVSNDNIDISILGNNFTAGGEELSLIVGITNRNSTALDLADLVMEYPKGSGEATADPSLGTERTRTSLGTIPAGAVRNENLKLVLFGQQGSVRHIKLSLEYRVEGSNAIFVKEKSYDVTVSSTPINLSVEAPANISPNQDITLNIKETLNAVKPASNIMLKLDYPVGFLFGSATPVPSIGNNIWSLGDLPAGAERNISITGKMVDVFDGEEKNFHIATGTQSAADKSIIDTVLNSITQMVTIKKPFIEAKLLVNSVYQREYAIDAKTPVHAEIQWTNNLDTKINDLQIVAKISGNGVNRKTINAQQGFYNSADDTITWDRNSVNAFKEVDPGDSGSVSFSFSPLPLFSAGGGLLTDPMTKVDVSISGKQSVEGYTTTDLNNSATSIIRTISDVGFSAKALYTSGPLKNTGPIPPKVANKTSYTILWSLSNTANSVSKASIHATLPTWISFAGPISPPNEDLTYNSTTREVVWNIGSIPKGTGITTTAHTVAFQVNFTPSLSQIGITPIIINEAVLTGHDDFANVDVKVSKQALSTLLDNDVSFPSGGSAVVE